MNLSVAVRFMGMCVAVPSAMVALSACGHEEQSSPAPVQTRTVSANPADQPKQWVAPGDGYVDMAGKPYEGICLPHLRPPGPAGVVANLDGVWVTDGGVVGVIANSTGAADDKHFGVAIIPISGTGLETVQLNVDVPTANELLEENGFCP